MKITKTMDLVKGIALRSKHEGMASCKKSWGSCKINCTTHWKMIKKIKKKKRLYLFQNLQLPPSPMRNLKDITILYTMVFFSRFFTTCSSALVPKSLKFWWRCVKMLPSLKKELQSLQKWPRAYTFFFWAK